MSKFIHLHNHTHYSLLDSITTVDELVTAAKDDGQSAIALTDHGVMFGGLELYKEAKYKGIKPIIGFEAYMANGSRFDRNSKAEKKRNYFHLLLLAKDNTGYRNLLKLTSLAHTEGMYYKPRIDRELLEKHKDGLIVTSACMGGVVGAHLLDGDIDSAKEAVIYYRDLFGDDFYLEIQNHFMEKDKIILEHVPKFAKEFNVKLIGTNDIHYLKKDNAGAHQMFLYIRDSSSTNKPVFDLTQLYYGTDEYYFKSSDQMIEIFKDYPEAVSNTLEVAEKVDLSIDLDKFFMPNFEIPKSSKAKDYDGYLEELVYEGLDVRYKGVLSEEVKNRADYELKIIKRMGFPTYFLIVWDFIKAARDMGISVGPGRGSAAGSLVAYALKITNLDPIEYGLLFERFLNPERVSMPDIDIDFADDKREMVIEYVKKKYGEKSVSMISTFGKLSTKAVFTDVGRVLKIPLDEIRKITSNIETIFGKVDSIKVALDKQPLNWLRDTTDEKLKELVHYAKQLENKNRSIGTHAAGVVIAPGDITDFVPLYKPSKMKESIGIDVASQYNMAHIESAGLLKMDFLGLKTLTIIEDTLRMIRENYGTVIDIDAIDFKDQKVYDLLTEGRTLSIFQFESQGMSEYMRKLKPTQIDDLIAMNALYRPGPMSFIPDFIDVKHGRKKVEYPHPLLKDILDPTNGIMVYQEQIMVVVQVIAGFSLGEADLLRRAVGKKDKKKLETLKPKFIVGGAQNGVNAKQAEEIFALIEKFADYGFNKSHSAAYSYLAYQTAWLKTHYTAEFLAANMTAELNNLDKIVELKEDAKKFGIKVFPPDVNQSIAYFVAKDNKIFFGLAGIKNVGVSAVDLIVEARKEQPFISIYDFCAKVDTRAVNKRSLEALVCSGAFDSLNSGHRASLFSSVDYALEYGKKVSENSNNATDSLFGMNDTISIPEPKLIESPEWANEERLAKEYEYLNFYLSGHPLDKYEPFFHYFSDFFKYKKSDLPKDKLSICGRVKNLKVRTTKSGSNFAFFTLEDYNNQIECIAWSDKFKEFGHLINNGSIIIVNGKKMLDDFGKDRDNGNDNTEQDENEVYKIVASEILTLEGQVDKFKGMKIWLDMKDEENLDNMEYLLNKINNNLSDRASNFELHFNVKNTNGDKSKFIRQDLKFHKNYNELVDLVDNFGYHKIRFM